MASSDSIHERFDVLNSVARAGYDRGVEEGSTLFERKNIISRVSLLHIDAFTGIERRTISRNRVVLNYFVCIPLGMPNILIATDIRIYQREVAAVSQRIHRYLFCDMSSRIHDYYYFVSTQ